MDNFLITVTKDKEVRHFEIGEYLHSEDEKCKFRVFESGNFVASFEPDEYMFLHVCQNPGKLQNQILDLIADEIEAHHPYQRNH